MTGYGTGYRISIDQLLRASTLHDIVKCMKEVDTKSNQQTSDSDANSEQALSKELRTRFIIKPSTEIPVEIVSTFVAQNFAYNEILTVMLVGDDLQLQKRVLKEWYDIFEVLYDSLHIDGLSFGLFDPENPDRLVGFAGNFHISNESKEVFNPDYALTSLMRFIADSESEVIKKLNANGISDIMHGFVEILDWDYFTSSADRLEVFLYMERKSIEMAYERGYQCIIATNTSPLTQDLATEVLGYEVEYYADEKVLAEYIDPVSGFTPWKDATRSGSAKVVVKYL